MALPPSAMLKRGELIEAARLLLPGYHFCRLLAIYEYMMVRKGKG